MKPIHFLALLILGAVWGASFLFIGVAVVEFGPLPLMFLRVLTGGLILVGIATVLQRGNQRQVDFRWREKWHSYLIIGLFNSALPFTFIAFSELTITVSLAAILNSTTPLFTALVAAIWGSERLVSRKISGIFMGMIGVAVLMGVSPLVLNTDVIIAVVASLLGALCYGTATIYAGRHITHLPAIYASIVQLLSAAILLALPAAFTLPTAIPSGLAIAELAALTLLSTAFAYLLYFFLLREVGPTQTASVTFLVPVFGSIWGLVFLQEPFNLGMILGIAIIFTSIALVMNIYWGRRKPLPLTGSTHE